MIRFQVLVDPLYQLFNQSLWELSLTISLFQFANSVNMPAGHNTNQG